nr:hypothetical protein [Tanacetum cinerariifolium]
REEESFDPIPRTPEDSEDDGNDEEDQGLKDGDEERLNEEEEADELYRDQESSLVSSQFVTSMQNPTSDAGMESIFATASSSVAPLQTSTPIMTPSTIATIITISHAPIPPTTIPSESVNAQLEDEVLTRSSHSSRTSYAVAADLSEMELKKILIEKMERNKSIQRSDEQRNLYKALVDAYEADKTILDSYGETVILKRRRDDDDDQEEGPSAGSDRGSKRRRKGKEPESASAPLETATRSAGRSTTGYLRGGASSRKYTTSVTKTKPADYGNINWIEDLVPRSMWIYEPINYNKHAFWGVSHWGRKRQQFYGFAVNQESALNVYSKRRIIAVTDLKIVEWHSYKHLDW